MPAANISYFVRWFLVILWGLGMVSLSFFGRDISNVLYVTMPFPAILIFSCGLGIAALICWLYYKLQLRKLSAYGWLAAIILLHIFLMTKVNQIDEIVHYPISGILSVLIYRALGLSQKGKQVWVFAFLLSATICIAEEVLQRYIPGRYFSWDDIFKNMVGAFFGLVIMAIILRERRSLPQKCPKPFA